MPALEGALSHCPVVVRGWGGFPSHLSKQARGGTPPELRDLGPLGSSSLSPSSPLQPSEPGKGYPG